METEKDLIDEKNINREQPAEEQTGETTATDAADETQQGEAGQTTDKELLDKITELNDRNLRLMAEFDNYRKRTLKERSELIKTAGEGLLANMLPLIDDFERALKAMEMADDVRAVREGVELIYEKFMAFLGQNGVKEIPTVNEVFNVDLHEAVTTFPAPSEDMKGKIMDCVNKGYTLNDKVIRYPKVVVCE